MGVLCNALKWVPIFGRGLGTAGYHGFKDRAIDNRVLAGGHGAALMPNHREYVARYLVGEEQSQTGKKARASFLMDIISTAAPYALFVLIAGIVGVYVAITATPVGIAVFLSFIVTWLLLLLLQRI